MKVQYISSTDELVLIIHPIVRNPNKEVGHFKLWWDEEGNICALAIVDYTEVLQEFRKSSRIIQLGGLWKGVTITEDDIAEVRQELLKTIEEKW